MIRNRRLIVSVDKKNDDETEKVASCHHDRFERNADVILHKLESLGAKMFLGVCVYILLDTHRQVAVAKAMYQPE